MTDTKAVYVSTITEFKNIKDLVEKILAQDERARNDDKWLTYRVFNEIARQHGTFVYIPFKLWEILPAFETVKRVRAKIQNEEGRYIPTDPEVLKKRRIRSKAIRDWAVEE